MAEKITLFSRIKSIFADNFKKIMDSVFAGETKEYTKMAKKFPKTVMPTGKDLLGIQTIQLKKTEINGKAISETMKNRIKQSMTDILNKPEYRVKTGKFAGRIKEQAVEDFKTEIKSIFEPYTRRGIGEKYPRNIDAIARTELTRTINETRKAYAEAFVAKNQKLELEKTWIHSRLPKEPRPAHKKLHGWTVPYKENFTIINKETGETYEVPYPHHDSLPAGEVINCMCQVRYSLKQINNKIEKAWQRKDGSWWENVNGNIVPLENKQEDNENEKDKESLAKNKKEIKAENEINSDKYNKEIEDREKEISQKNEIQINLGKKISSQIEEIIPDFKKKYEHYEYAKLAKDLIYEAEESGNHKIIELLASYEDLPPKAKAFVKAGIFDLSIPKMTIGWRYGEKPESGISHNFRDNIDEPGVSMMQIKGEEKNKGFAGLGHKEAGTPIKILVGYSAPWLKGSDDEPIMVGAKKIKSI